MKRKYKKALQDCFEPPAPQRKAQFLQQIQAEQSQDTATPLFFQRYPKWIRQSAMVFCAAAVLGIGYGAYQAFFDSRDQLEVVPPQETTITAWIDPATTTVTSQSMTSFTAETTRTTVTTGEKNSAETVLATAEYSVKFNQYSIQTYHLSPSTGKIDFGFQANYNGGFNCKKI